MYRRSTEYVQLTLKERLARLAILVSGLLVSIILIAGMLLATGIIEVV